MGKRGRPTKRPPRWRLARALYSEGLGDKEIAARYGVGNSTVARWRYEYHLRPHNPFLRHFREHYGKQADEEFLRLRVAGSSLTAIGQHFGFSREYARLVNNQLQALLRQRLRRAEGVAIRWRILEKQEHRA